MGTYFIETVFTQYTVFCFLNLILFEAYSFSLADSGCDTSNVTCYFKYEEVKCYVQIPACSNTTCESALRETVYCRIRAPLRLHIHCGCEDGFFRNLAGYCVPRAQCVKEQCNPPKIPDNPKCKCKRMTLVGILHPKDYRVCPSRSSSSSSCRSTSSSSSSECSSSKTDSSSCSSSSSSTSTSWHKREHSSDCNSFLSFIKRNKKSSLYLLNVCNCIPPYYLNSCGECVELCQCHKKCHKIHCPGLNERYCKHTGKCVCIDGCYKNDCGQCVRKDVLRNTANCLCSYPCPGPNMEFRKFNAKTARTCANLQCPPVEGPFQDKYACDCISGYYSLSNGTCVERCQCIQN